MACLVRASQLMVNIVERLGLTDRSALSVIQLTDWSGSLRPRTSEDENRVGAGDDAGQEGGQAEAEREDGGESLDHQESQPAREDDEDTRPPAPSSHADPARAVAAQPEGEAEQELEEAELCLTELARLSGLADPDKYRSVETDGAEEAAGQDQSHCPVLQPRQNIQDGLGFGARLAQELSHVLPQVEDGLSLGVVDRGRPEQEGAEDAETDRERHHLQAQSPPRPLQTEGEEAGAETEAGPGPAVQSNLQVEPPPPEVLTHHHGGGRPHQAQPQGQQEAVADDDLVQLRGEGGEEPTQRHHDGADEGAEPGGPGEAEVGGERREELGGGETAGDDEETPCLAPGLGLGQNSGGEGGQEVVTRPQHRALAQAGDDEGAEEHHPAPA